MQKQTGIHFYINIQEFAKIVCDEENKTGGVTHSIHALDTFFSSIENFGKKVSKNLVVEKITGSRLHLYIVDKIDLAFKLILWKTGALAKIKWQLPKKSIMV